MSRYSLQPTHRLPFFNAKITAKQIESSTTPVEFFDHAGHVLGLELKTNAKGFICNDDGTLYTDGVFVHEDAIVTAEFMDGMSTSWVVSGENEITTFDGKLYGRPLKEGEVAEYIDLGDGIKRKVLFSANRANAMQLNFYDLAGVPSFSKWTDDQQIEKINFSDGSLKVEVGVQTKTIVLLQEDGSVPPTLPEFFTLELIATLDSDNHTRFGRNFTITNLTQSRIVIKSNRAGTDYTVCGVNGYSSAEIVEIYPDARPNEVLGGEALFISADNSLNEFTGESGSDIEFGTLAIELNDGTPDILRIVGDNDEYNTDRNIRVSAKCSRLRRITISREDSILRSLVIQYDNTDSVIGILPPGSALTFIVGTDYMKIESTGLNLIPGTSYKPSAPSFTARVPEGTQLHVIDFANVATTLVKLIRPVVFSGRSTTDCRLEFKNVREPSWIRLRNSDGLDGDLFCIPAGNSRVLVQLIGAVPKVVDKSWNPMSYSRPESDRWEASSSTFDFTLDVANMSVITDRAYGDANGSNHLKIKLPIKDGESATVRMTIPDSYTYTGTSGPDSQFLGAEGTQLTGVEPFDNSLVGAVVPLYHNANGFTIHRSRCTFKIARSGNTVSVTELVRETDF